MFPVTDNSQTVINCLRSEARKHGVSERLNSRVTALRQIDDQWELELNGKEFSIADKVCMALGSLKQSGLEEILNKLGHSISTLLPSLFCFQPTLASSKLAGVAVQHAAVRTSPKSVVQVGPVLITHRGLSGPAILRASAWDARELAEVNYQFTAEINWLGEKTKEQILIQLTGISARNGRSKNSNTIPTANYPKGCGRNLSNLVESIRIPPGLTFPKKR